MADEISTTKIDPRMYLAIFLFRWKIAAVCVLYCLLGGVLYIQFAPREFLTKCTVMIWHDPVLAVSAQGRPWEAIRTHMWLLQGDELRSRTIERLKGRWLETLGGVHKMNVDVQAEQVRSQDRMLEISIKNSNPAYARDYLNALWEEFLVQQNIIKGESSGSASKLLEEELGLLEERIDEAEDDLIDYANLNAMDLTLAKGDIETCYLMALLTYQNQLNTELMILDALFPVLKDEDATVIQDVTTFTREAGTVAPVEEVAGALKEGEEKTFGGFETGRAAADSPEVREWQSQKVALMRLEVREKELIEKFRPENPEVKAVQQEIAQLKDQLKISAEVAFGRLRDRHKALEVAWNSLEVPISTWKSTHRLASQKRAGYRRRSLVVERRESMFKDLYSRLNDLKVSAELKADHFVMMDPVKTADKHIWPDPRKILLVAIMLALGSGVGLATIAHLFDNRMQSVSDVETVLGIPFLGGVPHWVQKKSETSVHALVLDANASGAIEAYRGLRTSILSSLDKAGQKIALLTSAESKEGKTLTVLNLSIMIAQAGKKVLLVDMDLRRPRLHRALDQERSPGITDALSGGRPLRDVVRSTSVPGLWFAPGGTSCDNAAELLESADMLSFFADAKEEYDYIFMDSSPVLRATDVSILAVPALCSVIYVAHVNRTPKPLIRYSLNILKDAHVLGLIMNNIDMNKIASIYYSYQYPNYAYYAYAYAYGYEYDYSTGDRKDMPRRKRRSWHALLQDVSRRIGRAILPM